MINSEKIPQQDRYNLTFYGHNSYLFWYNFQYFFSSRDIFSNPRLTLVSTRRGVSDPNVALHWVGEGWWSTRILKLHKKISEILKSIRKVDYMLKKS